AGQVNPGEVLDALLAQVGRLGGADRLGEVAGQGEALLLRLVGDGQVRLAGQFGVDLDEVRPHLLELADGLAPFRGVGRDARAGHEGFGPVHERSGGDDARAGLFALLDLLAQAEGGDGVQGVHVADTGDTVGQVERQEGRVGGVNVHVPQAGDEVLPL